MAVAWNELVSADTAASREFYAELLGWSAREVPAAGGGTYTLFSENGSEVAGMLAPPDETWAAAAGAPRWFAYMAVEDIDAAAARAAELGGAVLRPPFDIPGVGRIAIVADPAGAAFGLLQAGG